MQHAAIAKIKCCCFPILLFLKMIYLAPLQGFTDFVYRNVYNEVFGGIDKYFIPYISVKNTEVVKKFEKEILPENNAQLLAIPQVLPKNESEMLFLANYLSDYGYKEFNLNMGCPYPMVTNQGKGSGLLPHPEIIARILRVVFEKTSLKLSVKLRAGLESANEIERIVPVLNDFPITEVILHARIATQLYKGEINHRAFQFASENLKHPLVFNGDVFSVDDFLDVKTKFLSTEHIMLGRGVLRNPFLPFEIKNQNFSDTEKAERLLEFHEKMLKSYLETMDKEGNALNKMKQFWTYFSHNFLEEQKVIKRIKKARSLPKNKQEVQIIFKLHLQ